MIHCLQYGTGTWYGTCPAHRPTNQLPQEKFDRPQPRPSSIVFFFPPKKTHSSSPGVVYGDGDERRVQVDGAVHHEPLQVERQIRQRRQLHRRRLKKNRRDDDIKTGSATKTQQKKKETKKTHIKSVVLCRISINEKEVKTIPKTNSLEKTCV